MIPRHLIAVIQSALPSYKDYDDYKLTTQILNAVLSGSSSTYAMLSAHQIEALARANYKIIRQDATGFYEITWKAD